MKLFIIFALAMSFLSSCAHSQKCGCGDHSKCSHEMKKDSTDSKQDEECTDCKKK